MRCPYYLRDGTATDAGTWAQYFEGLDRQVAVTRVVDGALPASSCVVSTVFVGLDMNFHDGPPLIFETMVFGPAGCMDGDQWRWSTEAQALAGHERIVIAVCEKLSTPLVLIGVEDPWHA